MPEILCPDMYNSKARCISPNRSGEPSEPLPPLLLPRTLSREAGNEEGVIRSPVPPAEGPGPEKLLLGLCRGRPGGPGIPPVHPRLQTGARGDCWRAHPTAVPPRGGPPPPAAGGSGEGGGEGDWCGERGRERKATECAGRGFVFAGADPRPSAHPEQNAGSGRSALLSQSASPSGSTWELSDRLGLVGAVGGGGEAGMSNST